MDGYWVMVQVASAVVVSPPSGGVITQASRTVPEDPAVKVI